MSDGTPTGQPGRKEGPEWILAFDASTPVPTIVLGRVGAAAETAELVGSHESRDKANQASRTLVADIEKLVGEAGISLADLSMIGCGRGPGTFTGSRVAAATAKGLAMGLGVQVLPISTLAALAAGAGDGSRVLALLDARRGEVYAGAFDCPPGRVAAAGEEKLGKLAEVLGELDSIEGLRLHGPGVEPYADQIPDALRDAASHAPGIGAAGLWRATVSAFFAGAAVTPEELVVTYLRASYAEMGINAPRRPVKKSPWI